MEQIIPKWTVEGVTYLGTCPVMVQTKHDAKETRKTNCSTIQSHYGQLEQMEINIEKTTYTNRI